MRPRARRGCIWGGFRVTLPAEAYPMPETRSTIMPALRYRDARAAIDWLYRV